jgi:predicted porin
MDSNALQFTARWAPTDKLKLMAGFQHTLLSQPSNYQYYSATPVTVAGLTVASNTGLNANVNNNFYWLGGTYQITPTIKGSLGYYQQNFLSTNGATGLSSATALPGTSNKYESAMIEYALSKRTNLYAALMNVSSSGSKQFTPSGNSMTTAIQTGQFSYGTGIRHTF